MLDYVNLAVIAGFVFLYSNVALAARVNACQRRPGLCRLRCAVRTLGSGNH